MAQKTSTTLDWLSIGEAAKYLGVSRDTLRRWEKRGKIKSYRTPGGRRKYTLYDLEFAMQSPKPTPFIAPKPKPLESKLLELSPVLPEPKPKEEALKAEPTPSSPVQPPPSPQVVPSIPINWGRRLRNLAVGIAFLLALLLLLPAMANLLLTFFKGSGEILSPVPDIFRGF